MSDEKQKNETPPREISNETLSKVIELARLDPLAPGMALQKDHLKKILGHFSVLRTVSLEGLEPTIHINPVVLPVRDDEVDDIFTIEEALGNARLKYNEYFLAPKILGHDESGEKGADGK